MNTMLLSVKQNRSIYILGILSVVIASIALTVNFVVADSLPPQNISSIISRDGSFFPAFSYYNVQQQGGSNFNWSAKIKNGGPGDMHVVTIGFHSNAAGNSPTNENGFSIDTSGKTDYAEGESGTINFSFNTNKFNCGRVQVDAGYIDERYPNYHDTNFFAILIDYGISCGSIPTPIPTPTPTLTVVKTVRNVTQNSAFADSVNANPGDRVEFRIRTHSSNAIAKSVILSDTLPKNFTFLSFTGGGSLLGNNPVKISLGSVGADTTEEIRIQTQVANANNFPVGKSTWTNSVVVTSSNAGTKNDTASVVVNRVGSSPTPTPTPSPTPSPTPTPTPSPTPVPSLSINSFIASPSSICNGESSSLIWTTMNATRVIIDNGIGEVAVNGSRSVSPTYTHVYTLIAFNSNNSSTSRTVTVDVRDNCNGVGNLSISKMVRNLSSGNSYENKTVNANANDQLEFIIRVSTSSNNNNIISNLRVSDDLPNGLRYISGSTTVDGSYYNDGLTSGGIYLGTRYGNYSTVIKFRASADNLNYLQSGTNTLVNTARASADNTNSVNDTASVYLFQGGTNPISNLTIQKFVRNTSRGETVERTSTTASLNNTVEFILRVRNNSSTTAYNVNVYDPLPSGLTYVTNSTGLNGYSVGDGITSGGINIGTLNQNQEAIIRFFAIVNSGSVSQIISNTAQTRADNIPTIYSSAAVITIGNGIVAGALTIKTGASATTTLPLLGAGIATIFYAFTQKKKVKKDLNFVRI